MPGLQCRMTGNISRAGISTESECWVTQELDGVSTVLGSFLYSAYSEKMGIRPLTGGKRGLYRRRARGTGIEENGKEMKKTGERNGDDADEDRVGSQSNVPGSSLSALHVLTHLILPTTLRCVPLLSLQVPYTRKPRPKDVRYLVSDHTSRSLEPGRGR